MGMAFNNSFNNLCNSCTNIGCEFQSGIVRTECAFYMPPHLEPDNCGNYVVMQPTVETIPKADYETRLKADMVATLTEIQLEIEEIKPLEPTDDEDWQYGCFHGLELMQDKCLKLIQQKIDKLKEGINGENNN